MVWAGTWQALLSSIRDASAESIRLLTSPTKRTACSLQAEVGTPAYLSQQSIFDLSVLALDEVAKGGMSICSFLQSSEHLMPLSSTVVLQKRPKAGDIDSGHQSSERFVHMLEDAIIAAISQHFKALTEAQLQLHQLQ